MGFPQQTPHDAFTPRELESGVRSVFQLDEDEPTERPAKKGALAFAMRTDARLRLTIMTGVRAGEVLTLDGAAELVIGRARTADIRIDEQGVSRLHCRLVRSEDSFLLEDLGSMNGTLVNGVEVRSARVGAGDRIQIGANVVVQLGLFDAAEEKLARRLFEASTRDPLTGAYNRRYFAERLEAEVAYARRHGTGLAVMLLDLDFFKAVNDTAGHAAGDRVLQEVAGALSRCGRTEDLVARYGGEEFAILVRVDSPDAARAYAERVRSHVAALRVPFGERALNVTVSVGVAELAECVSIDDLIASADRRLYRAKLLGRDRVCTG